MLAKFSEIISYGLVEKHREQTIAQKWPIRMDLTLVEGKEKPSIYFDTKDKCDKWCNAINQILEQSQSQLVLPQDLSSLKVEIKVPQDSTP